MLSLNIYIYFLFIILFIYFIFFFFFFFFFFVYWNKRLTAIIIQHNDTYGLNLSPKKFIKFSLIYTLFYFIYLIWNDILVINLFYQFLRISKISPENFVIEKILILNEKIIIIIISKN